MSPEAPTSRTTAAPGSAAPGSAGSSASRPPLPGAAPDAAAADDAILFVSDEPTHLSDTPIEGWLALGLFWTLGATVAYQFVTRYMFNDSAAWTEEIARYLLIGMVFVGASVGVVKNNHIQVDFLYRYLPGRTGRAVSLGVDALRIAFFACMVVLMARMMARIGHHPMTVVPLPMNLVYGVCELALVAMTWRSLRLGWLHYRRGYSVLERPEPLGPGAP
jgi:TRAP-type C4-dicarboxylate transport system permease small subunit